LFVIPQGYASIFVFVLAFLSVIPEGNLLLFLLLTEGAGAFRPLKEIPTERGFSPGPLLFHGFTTHSKRQ
jgi:hypothetical protein